MWRRAQTHALRGFGAVAVFPWLRPWASTRLVALTDVVDLARDAVVRSADARDLLTAACVAALPAPTSLREALPDVAAGWGLDGEALLLEAWTRWQSA
ncbi:hypothetical protein SAMN05414137_12340 [Streptacidiphilus jiangxiensis]|uniref:Uncharacterized protein n=2 Tax=Streptacidiphilus jiangxiensis TaxID=235985 RepID=A0A1H7X922_STRJI|nr:hypothetical protein SAMN05414137_12340 [Streptacidiphilus jiangxiensis]